jgi:uncharacterized protein
MAMDKVRFEWDDTKDRANQVKHGVPFSLAQHAFSDPKRVLAQDTEHSAAETRFSALVALPVAF